jgi:predicted MPP superfamily phosphohydrolase
MMPPVIDLTFNVLLILLDAVLLVVIVRAKRVATGLFGIAVGLLGALLAAIVFQTNTFHLLRLYAYIVFLHLPLVLIGMAWILRKRSKWLSGAALVFAISICAIAVDAFLIEPTRLQVTKIQLHSPKVTHPLRLAVVADLQTDRIGEYERTVLKKVLDAEPDLILMPGDYLHENSSARRRLAGEFSALLAELDFGARLGAYAVRGNIDHEDWAELFSGSRVTPIVQTAAQELDEIRITGLDLRDSFTPTLQVEGTEKFHVVFGHSPNFALGKIDADLLVAGHTHGGQVRIPFIGPIMTFSAVPRTWAAGLTDLTGGRTLVVSRGIGMERGRAPRLRFLCPPEIVIVDIEPIPQH